MKRFFQTILALAVCAMALPVAAATPGSEPVEIPVVLSLTGGAAFLGGKEWESLKVLEAVVNQQGGIKGRPVKFAVQDDQSNPQVGVQLFSQLIARKVPLVYGPTLTAVCQAVQPLVERNGPLTFCLSPAVFPKPDTYFFMGAPSIDDVQPVVMRYYKSRGLSKMALITSTDASGSDFEKRVDGVLAQPEFRDLKLVAREHFATSDLNVNAQIARIKAANPDVLLSFTVGTPFGTLLRGIHDVGLDIPIYGSGGNFTYGQIAQYTSFLPKELVLNGSRGITPDLGAAGAVKKQQNLYYQSLLAARMRSEFATSIPWDPMNLVIDMLRKVGPNATAAQMKDYMESLKGWAGLEGVYDFSTHDQRGIGEAAAALFRYDAVKNQFVMVYSGAAKR